MMLVVALLVAWLVAVLVTVWGVRLAGYLAWRLAIDGLKPVPHAYALGLSGIQWVCALALAAWAKSSGAAPMCGYPSRAGSASSTLIRLCE